MKTRYRGDYYVLGAWNAICDRCGGKYKNFELRKTWQGFYVCASCWEPRHPQDYVRGVVDKMTPDWTRPPPSLRVEQFVLICTPNGRTSYAGTAISGCAIAGFVDPAYDPNVIE